MAANNVFERIGNVVTAVKQNVAADIAAVKTYITSPNLSQVSDANKAAAAAKQQASDVADKAVAASKGKLTITTDTQGNKVAGTPALAKPAPVTPTQTPVVNPAVGEAGAQALAAHIVATTPAATAPALKNGGTSSSTGIMSPSAQTAAFNSMNSSGTDISSAGSALSAFNDASAGTDPVTAQIESNLQALMTQASTPPPSLLNEYNSLLSSSGIQADQLQELNLQTIMDGTSLDIRNELTAHGGFATESQIQSLASTRNASLQLQLGQLQQGIALKQSWIDSTMQYTGQDYTNTEANFEKNYQLQNTLLSTLQRIQSTNATADYRFQNQQMAQLKFLSDSGALATASPDLIASYSATTGIDAATITAAGQNAAAKDNLSLELQAALLNTRTSGGTDVQRNTRVSGYLDQNKGSDQMVNASTYSQALQQFSAGGGTAANFVVQFPPSQYLNRDQIEALPSDVPEFETVKFNADLGDFVGAVQAGSLDATKAQNTLVSAYPTEATKIKDAFSALQ